MPKIDTQIDRVTVYTDRAQVTRKGALQLDPGLHQLELENLPPLLAAETVRARAMSTGRARLLSTDTVRTFHRAAPETLRSEIEAQLQALQERDEVLVRREGSIGSRRGYVQTLATASGNEIARGIAFGRVTVEAGVAVAAFIEEQLSALDADSVAIARERRELALEMGVLRSRLQSVQPSRPELRHTVMVQVQMETAGELALEVSYQVRVASWTPLYDLRVSESGPEPRLSLSYQAQVTQQTGEDWSAVALALSTAKPAASAVLPQFHPWYLRAERPMPADPPMLSRAMAAPAPSVPAAGYAASGGIADKSVLEEAEVQTAVLTESGPVVSFGLSGRTDIPSDGSPHKVTLAFHEFPARLDYVTAPKLVNQAFRRARATNGSKLLLLPGAAQVFYEDEFVGGTRLKTIAPGQEVELFLGVDDRIHVERKLVLGSVDRKFLADVRRLSYGYEIAVTNLRRGPQTVTVLDQFPVSRHESVKVRRGEVRPDPVEQSDLGKIRWELRLEPQQSRTVRFAFTIEAPRDLDLSGLPPLDSGEDG